MEVMKTISPEQVKSEHSELEHAGFESGQIIKAYDHEPRGGWVEDGRYHDAEYFVVGRIKDIVVTDFGVVAYRIEVIHDTTFTNDPREEVFVPLGVSTGDYDGRISLVSEVK